MASRLSLLIATVFAVSFVHVPASSALAAPSLTISATHSLDTFLKGQPDNTTVYSGTLQLTVTNSGDGPTQSAVTVSDVLPAGLSALVNNAGFGAGPVAASGNGWTCSGSTSVTCTRSDPLRARSSYPPIAITVKVATNAAALLTNTPTVAGGGDETPGSDTDSIPVTGDACPNGWSPEEAVSFAPPVPAIDSGVRNPERADGCTLLDVIWNAEPFKNHGSFVSTVAHATNEFVKKGLLSPAQQRAIQGAASRSDVGTKKDNQIPNSCPNRLAITFDDGPSFYRPQTLQIFRDNQVHGVFFDLGMRAEANPQIERFTRSEGHVLLNHTYNHTDMNALSDAAKIEEVQHNEAAFDAIGAPFTFKGIRTPFGSANTHTQEVVSSQGYTYFLTRIETGADYEPATTAEQTRDSILSQLHPGAIIGLHDGPIDTPAGAATVDAVRQILPAARAMGYCWGKVDHTGQVVADRYVSSGKPIPQITNPVPYNFLERPGTPPEPWFVAPDPIAISATHGPSTFVPGQTGTLTLTVTNTSGQPSDPDPIGGSTVTVQDVIPAGLTATAASGPGWTCSGSRTRTCTRSDTLGPYSDYPPITITVNVSNNAPTTIVNDPTVTAHGQAWKDQARDTISVARP
ncbi:polysaccharide deacetylase family protein [Planotetraspora kaengkrachanensis]|uniref:NodB homology domain-containing protein n=1 Tax=Planotetraspora kaengkrachanensis TaxID=575193 RepID=A0A8J3M000_9ACTN|nr:polysaccharide deacetylase family protein [Planotetraspora kaengkrachanensis]GIG79558.1 hypothetical protein Pka01_26850 [Planotetraspora kaengkrachanensis]